MRLVRLYRKEKEEADLDIASESAKEDRAVDED
jgi:hypothetical protein